MCLLAEWNTEPDALCGPLKWLAGIWMMGPKLNSVMDRESWKPEERVLNQEFVPCPGTSSGIRVPTVGFTACLCMALLSSLLLTGQ